MAKLTPESTLDQMPQQPALPEGMAAPEQAKEAADQAKRAVKLPLHLGLKEEMVLEQGRAWEKEHRDWFEPFRQVMERHHKQYRSQPTSPPTSDNMLFMPLSNSIVETATSRVVPALVQKRKMVEAVPQSAEQSIDQVRDTEDFINQQILFPRDGGLAPVIKLLHAVKGGIIEGVSFLKARWCRRPYTYTRPVTEKDPFTQQPVVTSYEEVQGTKCYAEFDPVSPFSLIWDPSVSWAIQDSGRVGEIHTKTLHELMVMQQNGELQGVEALLNHTPESVKKSGKKGDWEKQRKEMLTGARDRQTTGDQKVFQLVEWTGWLTWQDPKTKQWHQECYHWFVCEDKFLLAFDVNVLDGKRHGYGSAPFRVNPREMIGGPILEPVEDLQDLVNNSAGKLVDLIERVAETPLLYDRRSGFKGRTTIIKQRGMIPVTDVNGVKPLTQDPMAVTITDKFIGSMSDLARRSTPATEQAQGIAGESDTATEATILQRGASAQFSLIIETQQWCLICWLAREFYLFYKQFGTDQDMWLVESSVDGQPRQLQALNLKRTDYSWAPVGFQTQVDKPRRLEELRQALDIMLKYGPQWAAAGKRPRPDLLAIDELFPLLDVKNGRKYFEDAPVPAMGMLPGQLGAPAPAAAMAAAAEAGGVPKAAPGPGAGPLAGEQPVPAQQAAE